MFHKEEEEVVAKPFEQSKMPQYSGCMDCPHNQWGSAGRPGSQAKACNNYWRLSILPAAQFDTAGQPQLLNFDGLAAQDTIQCKLPITSGNGFKKYLKEQAKMHGIPKFWYVTAITLTPDPKCQFIVNFSYAGRTMDVDSLRLLKAKAEEAKTSIITPFQEPVATTQAAPQQPVAPAIQRF